MADSRREFCKKSALSTLGLTLGIGKLNSEDLTCHLNNGATCEGVHKDLMANGEGWTTFTPRKILSPAFMKQQGSGSTGLIISGNNNPESIDCWKRGLPLLKKGHRYRIECNTRVL